MAQAEEYDPNRLAEEGFWHPDDQDAHDREMDSRIARERELESERQNMLTFYNTCRACAGPHWSDEPCFERSEHRSEASYASDPMNTVHGQIEAQQRVSTRPHPDLVALMAAVDKLEATVKRLKRFLGVDT